MKKALAQLTQKGLDSEMSGLLDDIELAGLSFKIKDVISTYIDRTEAS